MVHFRDVALGASYDIPDVVIDLGHTKLMSRLGYMFQCPFSYKYTKTHRPISNTRFDHSRGVSYVVGEIARNVGWEPKPYQAGAFLHDVNHPDIGGHALEGIFDYESKLKDRIRNDGKVEEVLQKHGFDVREIAELAEHQIVQDWEVLDYAQRDSWHFDYSQGFNFGLEFSNLLLHMKDVGGRALLVDEQCGEPFDTSLHQFLYVRSQLARNVYHGDPERFAGSVIRNMVKTALDDGTLTEKDLYSNTPLDFYFVTLSFHKDYRLLLQLLLSLQDEDFFDRSTADWWNLSLVQPTESSPTFDITKPTYRVGHQDAKRLDLLQYRTDFDKKFKLEESIRDRTKQPVVVDWVPLMKPKIIGIMDGETVGEDLTPLYNQLNDLRIYSPTNTTKEVREFCERYFGVEHQDVDSVP